MPNLSYYTHNAILSTWGEGLTMGLLCAAPNPDGTGIIEPSSTDGYARQPVTFSIAQATGITTLQNTNSLAYGPATGEGWPSVSYFAVFDSSGNFLLYGRLRTERTTQPGEGIMVPTALIQVRLR